jgi:hypothetical protein
MTASAAQKSDDGAYHVRCKCTLDYILPARLVPRPGDVASASEFRIIRRYRLGA